MDIFNRYRFHVQTCMDAFAFRTRPLLALHAWDRALGHCAGNAKEIAEGALHWMIVSHNLSTAVLGGRAGSCTSHRLGYGGVWHTSNNTVVEQWLKQAEAPPTASHSERVVSMSGADLSGRRSHNASGMRPGIVWPSKEMCWAAARCPASGRAGAFWAATCDA